MTSTTIFAEILVVGLQAAVWLGLLFLLIADLKGINTKAVLDIAVGLKEWAFLITVFVIGLAYTLGIVVDRLADSAVSYLEEKLFSDKERRDQTHKDLRKDALIVKLPSSVGLMRMRVMSKSPEMTKFLEYIRSRMRIARSTTFNLVPTIIAAILFARPQNYLWLMVTYHGGLILLALSVFVSHRIAESYYARLSEAYGLIQKESQRNR